MDPPQPMEQTRCRALSSSSGVKGAHLDLPGGLWRRRQCFSSGKTSKTNPLNLPLFFHQGKEQEK